MVKAAPAASAARQRIDRLAKVAARFEAWRPAAEVLTEVRSVSTIFPQLDVATRVSGWPIERVALVHGPSNEGKTLLTLGLGLGFLMRGHFFALIDAEHTTPARWLSALMAEHAESKAFVALRPASYEKAVDAVRNFCERIGEAREKGEVDPDTTGIVVVDSVRKLQPKKLLEQLMKDGADNGKRSKGIDGYGGRAAQLKAALNAAWLDELVPLLAHTGTAAVLITRETDDPDAGSFDRRDFKIGGGKSLVYDSSLVVRVLRAGYVTDSEDKKIVYGERHAVEVWKTKIAGRGDERVPMAHFHTSNGALEGVAEGFDRPRDLLELGRELGAVEVEGSSYKLDVGGRCRLALGRGENAVVVKLHRDPALLARLEGAVRERLGEAT